MSGTGYGVGEVLRWFELLCQYRVTLETAGGNTEREYMSSIPVPSKKKTTETYFRVSTQPHEILCHFDQFLEQSLGVLLESPYVIPAVIRTRGKGEKGA